MLVIVGDATESFTGAAC